VKLQTLLPDTVQKAIGCYLSIAYGSQARGRRGPDLTTIEGKAAEACLSVFQKEQVEPIPGHPCVRYSLRLGNRNYPFMKLVLQEHLLAGEFYFAVDTHDQMDIKPDYPDYEAWMAVRRFNRDLKRQIEDEFGRQGIDTAACLCRAVREREAPASGGAVRGSLRQFQKRVLVYLNVVGARVAVPIPHDEAFAHAQSLFVVIDRFLEIFHRDTNMVHAKADTLILLGFDRLNRNHPQNKSSGK